MINNNAFIHPQEYFSLEFIEARKKQYNFTQATKVEMFLWDLELYGQLQRHFGDRVVLKGGAAAQLYFPPERQRTSVDIDVIFVGDIEDLHRGLEVIHNDLGGDDTFFKFKQHIPDEPTTVLPMETYHVIVPSQTLKRGTLYIKVDFHLFNSLDLDVIEIQSGAAFVLPLQYKPRCISAGTLLADKLLTFARGSIGIPEERMNDIMKQLYDVDQLIRHGGLAELPSFQKALTILFEKELSVRQQKIEFSGALQQMIDLLDQYSILNSGECQEDIRNSVYNFRGNYEPPPFRRPDEWEIIAKRIQFLVRAIQNSPDRSLTILQEAQRIEQEMRYDGNPGRGDLRQQLAMEFTNMLRNEEKDRTARRLRNGLPERLYWEVVSPDNLGEIRHRILTIQDRSEH